MTTIGESDAHFRSSVFHFISADTACTSLTVHQGRAPEPSPGPGLVWVTDAGALPEVETVLLSSSHLQGRHSHMKHTEASLLLLPTSNANFRRLGPAAP